MAESFEGSKPGAISLREMPHNLEAEAAALGSMMIDLQALERGVTLLRPDDFYRPHHKEVFIVLQELAASSTPPDLVTIASQLQTRGKLEEVGGRPFLTGLVDSVPTSANLEYYAQIVREQSIRRRLINGAMHIIKLASSTGDEALDVQEMADRAESIIFEVARQEQTQGLEAISGLLHQTFDAIDTLYTNKSGRDITGVPSGFHALDRMISGWQKNDLIILAARPSVGKTSLCMNMATHAALHDDAVVAVFSLEMSREQLLRRLIAAEARVNARRMATGQLDAEMWDRIVAAVTRLYDTKIYIDDSSEISALEMRAKCRRLLAQAGKLDLVVVDYLQLVRSHRKSDNRNLEVSDISQALKALAKELHVPVIALSQLSRSVESRSDRLPVLSDLRDSGAIEQDADIVMFIHRAAYYDREKTSESGFALEQNDPTEPEEAKIIVAKHRNGPTGNVTVQFVRDIARFIDVDYTMEGSS